MSITFSTARYVETEDRGTVLVVGRVDFEEDVNLSNANAYAVLDRLGYEGEYGETTPEEFLGCVLVANVGRDDSGFDGATTYLIDGPVLHDCGRRAGYFEDVMERLVVLAERAKAEEAMIAWG